MGSKISLWPLFCGISKLHFMSICRQFYRLHLSRPPTPYQHFSPI